MTNRQKYTYCKKCKRRIGDWDVLVNGPYCNKCQQKLGIE